MNSSRVDQLSPRARAYFPTRVFALSHPKPAPGPNTERILSMKRIAILTGILALAAPLAMAQTSTWISDPAHSEVDFTITHLSFSNGHGGFRKVASSLARGHSD